MSLDLAELRSVAGMTDEIGILSIYVTLDPQTRAEVNKWPWELRMRHQLAEVRERLKQEGTREHWKALENRLDELRLELERLVDPAEFGQGRALFVGVAGGTVRTVSLQVPLVDQAVLEPQAYLRPLVAAWSTAGPVGAVSISAEEVRMVDLRFGVTEVVGVIQYESPAEQRLLQGPAANNPALAQHSAPQHDRYERREEEKLSRFLRGIGPKLAKFTKDWGWGAVALTGETPLVQAVEEGLPPQFPVEVVTLDHPVNSLSPPKLAATVEPALQQARHRRHHALASQAHSNAMSANGGACGLSETLGALQEGRVSHLLLANDRNWPGSRTPEGFLAPKGEVPPGADPGRLAPEPRLGERMIELAYQEGATVTMLEPEEATPLADAEGIGAILRW